MVNKETICPKCKGNKVIKRGIIKTENKGNRQRFGCKDCSHRFIIDEPFKRMRNHEQIITQCMDLYYSGMSFRKITQHLQRFFPKGVTHSTIYRWIMKYVGVMANFTDKQKIELGETLECDDCGKKISEEEFYCKECKQKYIKKMERSKKASEKRQDESAIRNYDKWAKSGYRTY